MLGPLGDHVDVVRPEHHIAVAELNGEIPTDDHEQFVGIGMSVPNEFALNFHNFHVVIVDAGQPVRLPVRRDRI
ncbi:hypothetical protein D3C73_1657050 [compost metagenome]